MSVSDRIRAAGLVVPAFTLPTAPFSPYTLHQGLLTVSGQLPVRDGKPLFVGKVPTVVSAEQAQEATRLCVMNILGWVSHATNGDLERVERVLRLGGFVATADGYIDAPLIINTASNLITEIFGDKGSHARIAIGVASLPFGAPVEVEATFIVKADGA
ncbi:MAG: RidA family protein [Burkholderiaceae bacterium]|nr:RidA family protein [Burkholderiaceae bacterium]